MSKLSKLTFIDKYLGNDKEFISIVSSDYHDIDLSGISLNKELFITDSNLENTNIKICLNDSRFYNSNLKGTEIFFDENIPVNTCITLNNVILDEKGIAIINSLMNKYPYLFKIDLNTILNNKNLNINSYVLDNILNENEDINPSIIYKRCPAIKKIHDSIKDQVDEDDIYTSGPYYSLNNRFIRKVTFKDLVIDKDMFDFLINFFDVIECKFENCTFDFDLSNFIERKNASNALSNTSFLASFKDIYIPNLKVSDYKKFTLKRLGESSMTFRKNLYLELGRSCNGSCRFCRNECLEKVPYDLDKIEYNLKEIIDDFDEVVIGGGEPTLRSDDLIKLYKDFSQYKNKLKLFTNGSNLEVLKELNNVTNGFLSIYLSRHHYNNKKNNAILGVNQNKLNDIINETHSTTLQCVCHNGGLSSLGDITDYIINNRMAKTIILSNLQRDTDSFTDKTGELYIDDTIFDEVINYLKRKHFKCSIPIISSGGYELYILDGSLFNSKLRVVIKRYVSQKELNERWPYAIKRTFDLSMNPNGDIYFNWSNKGDKVKIK